MKTVEFTDPHRRKHFDFFRRMDQPHFNITANVDIGPLLKRVRSEELPFTPLVVYFVARAANEIPEFRQRIRGETVVEHELVHPSFTVSTPVSDVFSFCEVPFQYDRPAFLAAAADRIDRIRQNPSFEDEPGRDDYLFLSAIPWVAFTSLQHAMHYSPADSVPRIAWGKYFPQGERILMPLAVQAHHALVDGRHMGAYFERIQDLLLQA